MYTLGSLFFLCVRVCSRGGSRVSLRCVSLLSEQLPVFLAAARPFTSPPDGSFV